MHCTGVALNGFCSMTKDIDSHSLRRTLATLGMGLFAAVQAVLLPAMAQDFPVRPVRVVVPYSAGGPVDMMARAVSKYMANVSGQPFTVENRGGAGGTIGTALVARSTPDGYTVVFNGTLAHTLGPMLRPKSAGYTLSEMSAVGVFSSSSNFLVVAPSLQVKSVKELIARAKAEDGKLAFSSAGPASNPHLGAELFKSLAGVNMEHIAYKGVSDTVPDLVSGRVPVAFASPTLALPLIKDNRLVALATTGEKRMKGWEQLPTMAEAGVPGYVFESTYIMAAPAKTPANIMARLNTWLQQALDDPETRAALDKLGLESVRNSTDQADQLVLAELRRWENIVKRLELKLE
ncbi:MAG: tripartite tricarboxylate transporter substrate binding protein [Betaproteobacteria bacterium]|jgi:tripartite-type tricarboxylate transporter receptor subunit TctC|nr:tripartite tricarboxylate transporter substrate binding protein [Betaproteobacteria bacterium]